MYKISKQLSREWLANPHKDLPLLTRLQQNGSTNLIDNRRIIDMGNGYDKIEAIDPGKRFEHKKENK